VVGYIYKILFSLKRKEILMYHSSNRPLGYKEIN
jgi:hypothetical protein